MSNMIWQRECLSQWIGYVIISCNIGDLHFTLVQYFSGEVDMPKYMFGFVMRSGLLACAMALVLSQNRFTGLDGFLITPNPVVNFQIYIASLAACAATMYLSSVVDSE